MRVIPSVFLLLALFVHPVSAAPNRADALFAEEKYAEAKVEYEKLLKAGGKVAAQASYRKAECEVYLQRFAEAAQWASQFALPADGPWRARLLFLRTQIYEHYLQQYGWHLSEATLVGGKDITQRSRYDWENEIKKDYAALWATRATLIAMPLAEEKEFLELKKIDEAKYPHLWSVVVDRWVQFLQTRGTQKKRLPFPQAPFEKPGTWNDNQPPAEQAAGLFASVANSHAGAKETWQAEQWGLPFTHPTWFEKRPKSVLPLVKKLSERQERFQNRKAKASLGAILATAYGEEKEYEAGISLCRLVEKWDPQSTASQTCVGLRSQWEQPEITVTALPLLPNVTQTIPVTSRNLATLYFRWLPISWDRLKAQRSAANENGYYFLKTLELDLLKALTKEKAAFAWKISPEYAQKHEPLLNLVSVPPTKEGFQVLLISENPQFEASQGLVRGALVRVSSVAMLGSASPLQNDSLAATSDEKNALGGFHVYLVDTLTGEPKSDWDVTARQRLNWQKQSEPSATTDANGRAAFAALPSNYQSISLDPLLKRNDTYALLENSLNLYQYDVPSVHLTLDLDRPLYRQGQTVKFKATAYERAYPAFKTKGAGEVEIEVRNASGKSIYQAKLALSGQGSAAGEFTLPTSGMLGSFNVEAALHDNGKVYNGYAPFTVEAFVRPELELSFDKKTAAPCRFAKPCEVVGKVATYAGTALAGRAVTYRIVKEPIYPFWDFWRGFAPHAQSEEIGAGVTTTQKDGTFKIPFVPTGYDDFKGTVRFSLAAETRELGGRTISASQVVMAGESAFQIAAVPKQGFFDEGTQSEWSLSLPGLNGEPTKGDVDYTVYALKADQTLSEPLDNSPGEFAFEAWAEKQKTATVALQGRAHAEGNASVLKLPALPSGVYRLTLKARDAWNTPVEASRPFVVAKSGQALKAALLPERLTIARQTEVTVGDAAEVLLGSGRGGGRNFVELWQGRNLIDTRLLPAGIQHFAFPVTAKARGGVTVRWFSYAKNKLTQGSVALQVPWKDKALTVTLTLPEATKPTSTLTVPIDVKTSEGSLPDGEGTLRVFDRSLEYYSAAGPLGAQALYPQETGPELMHGSHFVSSGSWLPTPPGWLDKKLGISADAREVKERPDPAFRFENGRGRHAYVGGKGMRMAVGRAEGNMRLAEDAAPAGAAPEPMQKQSAGVKAAPASPAPAPRTHFSETAAFVTALKLEKGKASAAVTFPDSLTSWKAETFFTTADGRVGYASGTLSTQRPFSVELALTRFLREGDYAEFQGVLYNNTPTPATGLAIFRLIRPGEKTALIEKKVLLTVSANSQRTVLLPIDSSLTLGDYEAEFTFQGNPLSDSLKKTISLLPARQLLVASDVVLMEGNGKARLSTTKLGVDSTLKSATLAIEPNLALSVVGSLPHLSTPSAFSLDGLLNRYVPLVGVKKLFEDQPQLRRAAEELRKRKPNRQAWDLNDPRRILSALESPWASVAEGKTTEEGVDLLDANLVKELSEVTREKIKSYQKEDGSFTWFPGGPSDPYMTLTALAAFQEADDLGVAFDEDTVKGAAGFVMRELQAVSFKPSESYLSLKLYCAYLISALGEKHEWAKPYLPTIESWLTDAEKSRNLLTPLGRAYAARAYFQLGNSEKANVHLNRVLSDAVDDPITGLSWKLEETSWMWYHDSLEKHLFVLRTLLKVRPGDPKVASLVRGLFWQRKGNQWNSPRHTANAVLAMVDYLKKSGAFTENVTAQWTWGGEKGQNTWKPLDPQEKAVSMTQREPKAAFLSAEVDKQGPGLTVASLTTLFESSKVKEAQGSLLQLKRQFYLRGRKAQQTKLTALTEGDAVKVGDVVEVEITLKSRSQFEYLHLRSPRGAGFEPEEKLSGWKWDGVSRYQEIQDSLDQIFISWLPNGTYRFRFPLRATIGGKFHLQSAQVQSMYSPDIAAFTESGELSIVQ